MSSILTNTSAMVALQTLKGINSNLTKTQDEISTGKSIASARDNSAVWAISKVMESDVSGFSAISSSLSLGQSTVGVAADASGSITDLLNQMKEKIVAAQESNVDRTKIQTDINALKDQIDGIVSGAQFNGLNLLQNSKTTTAFTAAGNVDGTGSINVLASLDRSSGGVSANQITVAKQDLSTTVAKVGTLAMDAGSAAAAGTATASGAAQATYTIAGDIATTGRTSAVMAGDSYSFDMTKFDVALAGTPFASATDTDWKTAIYTAKDGETTADVAKGLTDMINYRLAQVGAQNDIQVTVSGNKLSITNNTATDLAASAATDITVKGGGTVGGGLALLSEFDVTTDDGAAAALSGIESVLQTSITAAASFGSAQGRIDTQADFVSKLIDSMKTGIGSLVDADMEEASAKLQALQVQQQLGIQSLSIANQAPQTILSLFRG